MQLPIHIELRRSRLLFFLPVVLHQLAAGCLWALLWPFWRCAVSCWQSSALSAWHALRPSTVVGLRLDEAGELLLLYAGGDRVAVSVQSDTVVFSQLIVLRTRDDKEGRINSLARPVARQPVGRDFSCASVSDCVGMAILARGLQAAFDYSEV